MSFNCDLKTSKVFIGDNYVINQIKEGVHIEVEQIYLVEKLIKQHLPNTPFIYISDRKYSYSVNPMTYKSISNIENMEAFIVVTYDKTKLTLVNFEKQFYDKTFMVFEHIDDAIAWTKDYFKI